MPATPKPKKGTPDDLAEVERALSVLQGRHPEHERARREDHEARERRSVELDVQARVATSAARSRYIRVAAIAVPVVLLLGFIGALTKRELGRRSRVGEAGEPFRAFGFTTVDTSSPSTPGTLETTVEPGCLLAVSTEGGAIRITRAGNTSEGTSPTLFCTCASERVGLSSVNAIGPQGGLLLLRTDAATLGGSRAFSFAPFKPASTLRTDEPCSEASLDAWIDAKRYPAAQPDPKWLDAAPRRAALAASGFKVAAVARADVPFVVLEIPKESCLIVTSDKPSDRLGLRMKGGAAVIPDTPGTLGRCAQTEGTFLVSREGSGELAVLVAPAARLGGMRGLREVARDAGLVLAATQVPPADRAWDAKQLLGASQVPDALISTASTPEVPVEAEPRVVTLSFETPNALVPETPDEVFSFCDPSLEPTTREAMCIFSGPQKWRTEGAEAVGGLARAKLPFWLYAMQGVTDPLALKVMTQLFSIARRLGRDSFTPTTLEALTELPNGVEVLGRTGEDAIVAVGVAPSDPWVYPLTDGPLWTLDGVPRIVPVKPLEKVTLSAIAKVLPPKPSRRTVVFRRQKH
jgi:hypothetical protein